MAFKADTEERVYEKKCTVRSRMVAFCIAMACCGAIGPAHATLVSFDFAGAITGQSGDADALFGTSGGIVGQSIVGSFSYDTDGLIAPSPISNSFGRVWDTTDGSMAGSTVLIKMTINGVLLQYTGGYFGDLTIIHGCPTTPVCGPWAYGGSSLTQLFTLASDNNVPNGANAAQINLGMYDNSANLTNAALDPAGPFNLQAAQFQSNGANWWLPDSAAPVTWDFRIDSSVSVPEPSSLVLLTLCLAGLGLRRKKQNLAA